MLGSDSPWISYISVYCVSRGTDCFLFQNIFSKTEIVFPSKVKGRFAYSLEDTVSPSKAKGRFSHSCGRKDRLCPLAAENRCAYCCLWKTNPLNSEKWHQLRMQVSSCPLHITFWGSKLEKTNPNMPTQSAFHIPRFHIWWFNQPWIKNILKKIPESPQKANLNLPLTDDYLHSICIVLGIIINLKII